MDLERLQQDWNELARRDAMWAVLTGPAGTGRDWDAEAFFQTGADEIAALLARLTALGVPPARGRALDFGCGPGRLTQALAASFACADGVDISPVMVDQARALNRHGDRCRYHANRTGDLALFADASFDLVYSAITLQHMAPDLARRYIGEFFRVLRPGGLAVFQVPSHARHAERPQTRQQAALMAADCRATISTVAKVRCAPGAALPLRVLIENRGRAVWSASARSDDTTYAVRLGNHWRGRFGRMRVFDDRRAGLPFDLAPGASLEVEMRLTAPAAGTWTIELDMVQESVRWFEEAGSPTAWVRLRVDPALPPGTVEGLPRVMEMHGISRDAVTTLVQAAGGTVIAADDDDSPGPDWASFRYVTRRAPISGAPRPGE